MTNSKFVPELNNNDTLQTGQDILCIAQMERFSRYIAENGKETSFTYDGTKGVRVEILDDVDYQPETDTKAEIIHDHWSAQGNDASSDVAEDREIISEIEYQRRKEQLKALESITKTDLSATFAHRFRINPKIVRAFRLAAVRQFVWGKRYRNSTFINARNKRKNCK